jgi:hypothetical protein
MLEKIEDVLKALHKHGITKITIAYEGGHDEGTFDECVFYKGEDKVMVEWDKVINDENTEFDDDHFLGLIYSDYGRLNQHYSFASEYSCRGTVTINTETGDFNDDGYEHTETDTYHTGNVFKEQKEVF